jgi:hypothetical protein
VGVAQVVDARAFSSTPRWSHGRWDARPLVGALRARRCAAARSRRRRRWPGRRPAPSRACRPRCAGSRPRRRREQQLVAAALRHERDEQLDELVDRLRVRRERGSSARRRRTTPGPVRFHAFVTVSVLRLPSRSTSRTVQRGGFAEPQPGAEQQPDERRGTRRGRGRGRANSCGRQEHHLLGGRRRARRGRGRTGCAPPAAGAGRGRRRTASWRSRAGCGSSCRAEVPAACRVAGEPGGTWPPSICSSGTSLELGQVVREVAAVVGLGALVGAGAVGRWRSAPTVRRSARAPG